MFTELKFLYKTKNS